MDFLREAISQLGEIEHHFIQIFFFTSNFTHPAIFSNSGKVKFQDFERLLLTTNSWKENLRRQVD
jgi:hypothetical protein